MRGGDRAAGAAVGRRAARAAGLAALCWVGGAAWGADCVAVESDRFLAADLARVAPAFGRLTPEEPLGYAPAPGARRILSAAELARLAARYGLAVQPQEVCLERAVRTLSPESVLAALRAALGRQDARIELVDFSRQPVPRGELEFPRSGLGAPVAGDNAAVLWRGRLRYDGARTLPVWARVRITAPGRRLVALENLAPGKPVAAAQLRVEEAEWFPLAEAPLTAIEQAAGKLPRRWIRAGSLLYARMLDPPREVERGEEVSVEVASGAAQLRFTARAESAGRAGDVILVRSAVNGRRLAARVAGPGKVVLNANRLEPVDRGGARGR